ncbi:penicillin-binding protein [Pradoshia eiseniae]|uniref:Penicillin-binding protein n=1 Tax=Pradoshia eiseniae TaxID=2064768 RepID=A0A2S7N0I8_9BACI|nr:PBP1A family penicillin-binding protein [Pradoshia eiseniae]PQD95554.1 penicillin-binding protein [Pradoshia eiseniae]
MSRMKQILNKLGNFLDHSKVFHILLLSISILTLIGLMYLTYLLNEEVDLSNLDTELMKPTIIYDKDNEEASKITANKMEGVSINEVPEHVIDAVLSIEDHRFYEHHGIDMKGIIRAAFENLFAGGIVQGGSTITQQLAKNTILTPEKTYERKIKEVVIAGQIEQQYSKDEILEMYLNQIYFGHGAWGIQNASRVYFGKNVEDVTLAEAAMLAGLIHSPSALDPYKNFESAKKRQGVVLAQMKAFDEINETEYDKALVEDIQLKELSDPLKGKYPYYVDQVIYEAVRKYGLEQDDLLTGGYKIYTELDQNMQEVVEKVYAEDGNFTVGSNPNEQPESAAVLLDPNDGGVRALVGGRSDHVFLGYNRATQLKAQPGSTMKPLAVYTPALEEGYGIKDLLLDEKTEFAGGYSPKNNNNQYDGEVPMFEAVYKSKNIPAVWLLNEIGIQTGMDAVERFGIKLDKGNRQLGLALGGGSIAVSPLKMAQAYSALANEGVMHEGHLIKRIVNKSGETVASFEGKEKKVTTKQVAKDMTTMLKGVVDHESGTGRYAKVDGWDIAGKTGSTQVDGVTAANAIKDQWFVGYSPNLVGAVWSGYDKTTSQQYLVRDSTKGSAIIFQKIMSGALPNVENEKFDVPSVYELEKEVEKKTLRELWEEQKKKINDSFNEWIDRWRGN